MPQQEIKFMDPHRLFVGDNPASFLVEVVVRAVITYILLLVTMRLMGKRMASQMSALELTIIVSLGAAIGVPLEAPDRGMIAAAIVLAIAAIYQQGINYWSFKSRRAELVFQGDVVVMVYEGRLQLDAMRTAVLSRERLFSVFRQERLVHLGQIKRAYMEADGRFSIYKIEKPPPGLCLIPGQDMKRCESRYAIPGHFACCSCGALHQGPQPPANCPYCQNAGFSPAVQVTAIDDLDSPPSPC